MKKRLLAGVASVAVSSLALGLALSLAFAEPAKRSTARKGDDGRPVSTKSLASRTALCKADCLPDNLKENGVGMHGLYRSYSKTDPHLVSPDGKKQYAECVKKCLDPLPDVYVQRAVFAMGVNWFGKTKQSCLDCHLKGH